METFASPFLYVVAFMWPGVVLFAAVHFAIFSVNSRFWEQFSGRDAP